MTRMPILLASTAVLIVAVLTMPRRAWADAGQDSVPRAYTLDQAVTDALANHPRLRASVAEETAAEARIDEAKTARLPDVGVSPQLNRYTGNTAPGAFFMMPGCAPIAGPT